MLSEKNRSHVFVLRGDKAVRVPVTIGFDDAVSVEIVDGVQPGDAVITAGKQGLADGQRVEAAEAG